MTLDLTSQSTAAGPRSPYREGTWRQRRRERQRLAAQDRRSARLAELLDLCALLTQAEDIVSTGWVQGGWFAYLDDAGRQHTVTAGSLHSLDSRQVVGACLVGAVVQAGGGISAAHTQPVHRALDLTWYTLWGRGPLPEQWCPAPAVRAAHVRQLTTWNDQPGRSAAEVAELLTVSAAAAATESVRLRTPSER